VNESGFSLSADDNCNEQRAAAAGQRVISCFVKILKG